jgi:hypothetical protein
VKARAEHAQEGGLQYPQESIGGSDSYYKNSSNGREIENRELVAFSPERILFIVPAAVLTCAFVGICIHAGTMWPWDRVVHEDGRRTLLQTIFFFEHGTRELLVDLVLALAVSGSVQFFYGKPGSPQSNYRFRLRWMLTGLAITTLLTILIGTAWAAGKAVVLENLEQLPTRTGGALVWGSHWRYHLLERLSTMLLALGLVGICRLLSGRPAGAKRSFTLFAIALGTFGLLTVFFGPTLEPFRNARFLGHQAREWLTHVSVTLPLALGTCLALTPRNFQPSRSSIERRDLWVMGAALAFSVSLGVYVLLGAWLTKSMAEAQSSDLASVVLAHFFEHSFTYLLVPSVAGSLYLWSSVVVDQK